MQQNYISELCVYSSKKDDDFEFDFTLPEYLPGIARIIKTKIRFEKCVCHVENGKVTMDADACISVLYTSDFGGKIKSALFRESLTLTFRDAPVDECVLVPSCYVSSISSKPFGTRKLHTKFTLHASVLGTKTFSKALLCDSECDGICLNKEKISVCSKASLPETVFDFDAETAIDKEKPAIEEIIFTDARVTHTRYECSDGVLRLEADIEAYVLYEISDDDGDTATYATAVFPTKIKQELDNPNVNEKTLCTLYLDIVSLDSAVSFDPYGENRLISFSLRYSVSGTLYNIGEFDITTDAFSERFEETPSISKHSFECISCPVSTSEKVSATIRGDFRDMYEISDVFTEIQSVSYENTDSKHFATTKCVLHIFGTNENGELCASDCPVTLHVPIKLSESAKGEVFPEVILCVSGCSATLKEGELSAEFIIDVCGVFLYHSSMRIIEDISENTEKPKDSRKGKVTIYYPSKDESLWSIAKRYSTNPERIKASNSLESDSISGKHILIIPSIT